MTHDVSLSLTDGAGAGARESDKEKAGGHACLINAGDGEVKRGEETLSLHNHI